MMRDVDPVADARALVAERFPAALAAFLGAGVLSARRTATSDLDIVVILAGPPAPYRESVRFGGWPVELFVHDGSSLAYYLARDVARRRPTMARLCADGPVLVDRDGTAGVVRARAAALLAAGPPPVPAADLDHLRYGLSDLLDDLAGCTDDGESMVISWLVFEHAARLALLVSGHWLGTGKWLLRELRDLDGALADRLLGSVADPRRLEQIAGEVLASAGGRLWEGYRAAGEPRQPG
jgi:hypothetical protein